LFGSLLGARSQAYAAIIIYNLYRKNEEPVFAM
jgi:hypothetical protein